MLPINFALSDQMISVMTLATSDIHMNMASCVTSTQFVHAIAGCAQYALMKAHRSLACCHEPYQPQHPKFLQKA
jgi:citrate lyase gamma subunit